MLLAKVVFSIYFWVPNFLCMEGRWAERLNKLLFRKAPNYTSQKCFKHFRANIWELVLGLIYLGRQITFLRSVLTSRYAHSPTQKFLLFFWKCHPSHTVLWKLCSRRVDPRSVNMNLQGAQRPGKATGHTKRKMITQNTKLTSEIILNLWASGCYFHSQDFVLGPG